MPPFFMLLRISRFPYPIYAPLCPSKKAHRLIKGSSPPFDPRATAQVKRIRKHGRADKQAAQTGGCGRKGSVNGKATSAAFPFISSVRLIRSNARKNEDARTMTIKQLAAQTGGRAKNRRRGRFYPLFRKRHMRREGGCTENTKRCGGKSI